MNYIKHRYILAIVVLIFLQIGCTQYPAILEPDKQMFDNAVHAENIRDSLVEGKLVPGMPHFVVSQLFKNWTDGIKELKIPVATLGSKQRLEEEEGWGRKYVDPNTKIFLDEYETRDGKLYVWYQRPDFYTMDVSSRDTLYVYLEDTVYSSVINYLNKSSVLTIRDSLHQIPTGTNFYAQVRYTDHPWREVSNWYNVQILSNRKTIKLGEINYEFYPIELLEFNKEPVSSFKWREVNKNEN